jgi:hypothetical protein
MSHCAILSARFLPLQRGGGEIKFQGSPYMRGYGGFSGSPFMRGYGNKFVRYRTFRLRQRGEGWGSIWNLIKGIAPKFLNTVTSGAKIVGKQLLTSAGDQAITSGMQFLGDVASGENVMESATNRLKEGGNEFANTAKVKLRDGGMTLAHSIKRKLAELKSLQEQQQQGSGFKKLKTSHMKKTINTKRKVPIPVTYKTNFKGDSSCHFNKCSKLPYSDIYSSS